MKTHIAVAVASLFVASLGIVAYAQQTMPQQASPQSSSMSHQSMAHDNMSNDMSSDMVTDKVKKELKSHGLSSDDISVSFASGTATLSGTVASKRDVKKAKQAAMKVKGVKHVDTSGLQVRA